MAIQVGPVIKSHVQNIYYIRNLSPQPKLHRISTKAAQAVPSGDTTLKYNTN